MKLMIVIVRDSSGDTVIQTLVSKGYRVTRIASTGGFLRKGNNTLLLGVQAEQVDDVIALLRQTCLPQEQEEHKATIFIVDMPYYEQI